MLAASAGENLLSSWLCSRSSQDVADKIADGMLFVSLKISDMVAPTP